MIWTKFHLDVTARKIQISSCSSIIVVLNVTLKISLSCGAQFSLCHFYEISIVIV